MSQGDRDGRARYASAKPRGRLAPLPGKQSTWHRTLPHSVPTRPQEGQTPHRVRTALRGHERTEQSASAAIGHTYCCVCHNRIVLAEYDGLIADATSRALAAGTGQGRGLVRGLQPGNRRPSLLQMMSPADY